MKQIFRNSLAALVGIILTGCTSDYTDWASPQTNSPEEAIAKYGITAAAGEDADIVMPVRNDIVKLVALKASSDQVADFKVTSLTVNDEPIEGTVDKGNITVSAQQLGALIEKMYNSRAAVKRTLAVKAKLSLLLKNGDAVTTDITTETAASFTPKPTPAIDEKGYYLLGNFQDIGWNLGTPGWMTKESDGVYTAVVTIENDGDNWFKFYEGSHYSDSDWDEVNKGQMGCAVKDDKATENFVVYTGDTQEVQTPVVNGDKGNQYKITLDMNNLTYKVVRQAVNYYIVGGPNDWAGSCSDKTLKFGQANIDNPVYTITFPAAAEGDTWFAIGDDKACDAIANNEDGAWDLLYATTKGNGNNGSEGSLCRRKDLTDRATQGDGSFKVEAGVKFITVTINMKEMTYEVKGTNFSEYIYEAGVNNAWGDFQQPLYSANSDGIYTGFFEARSDSWTEGKGAFKFRGAADNWDNGNYGTGTLNSDGLSGTLIDDGNSGNIMPEPGFYRADVNLTDMTFKLTPIKSIYVVGSAVNNDWDTGVQMTFNAEEHCWECTTTLNEGQIKFKGNGTWDTLDGNWGGTLDNIVNGSNDNIDVPVTGNVHIKFYPTCDTKSYATITAVAQ